MYSVIDRQSLDRKVCMMAPGQGMFLLDCRVHKKPHTISMLAPIFYFEQDRGLEKTEKATQTH